MESKVNIITIIHIDLFFYKRMINYLNAEIEIIECNIIDNFIKVLKNKIKNIIFITENIEYKNMMNIKLKKLNLSEKCYITNNIINIIKKIDKKILLIGNSYINKYNLRLNNTELNKIMVIDTNEYNIKYIDNDPIFNSINNIVDLLILSRKNICNIFDDKNINERIKIMIRDSNN
jgi:hypothetical protein